MSTLAFNINLFNFPLSVCFISVHYNLHIYIKNVFAGKLISQKREDLNCILDQFNIQVDNPVAILNQDTSRHFLNSKSPHDKYKVWLNKILIR